MVVAVVVHHQAIAAEVPLQEAILRVVLHQVHGVTLQVVAVHDQAAILQVVLPVPAAVTLPVVPVVVPAQAAVVAVVVHAVAAVVEDKNLREKF